MESTIETLSPTRVRLAIEVPFAELEPSLRKAYREIGSQINIPGFRKGKVPPPVIDQRVGRGTVLTEAVQDAIPTQVVAALQEHDVQRTLGRPSVEITEFADGQPLKFTAEVDIRPEISLPDPATITVTVDAVAVDEADVERQVDGLRLRFSALKTVERPAQDGDFVQIDLKALVDGEEVEGGSATNMSHEVGSGRLLPGLDEALVGLAAGDEKTFTSALVAGDHAGRDAEVTVTVRTVKEREMPEVDDDFASMASEFDTIEEMRADFRARLARSKQVEQLYAARDNTLSALLDAAGVPAPEGVVKDEVEGRKEQMTEQLQRMGATMEDFLRIENKTEEEVDAELTTSAERNVRAQLLLDAFADAEEVNVSDDEFGHEIVHRAQHAGVGPQQYYDQLVRAGMAPAVFGDVRRGKMLSLLLRRVTVTDSDGEALAFDELEQLAHDHGAAPADDHDDHDHDDHEGHDHD